MHYEAEIHHGQEKGRWRKWNFRTPGNFRWRCGKFPILGAILYKIRHIYPIKKGHQHEPVTF
jgi:hypothetical protein